MARKRNYSAWYDFSKAYDSIHLYILRNLYPAEKRDTTIKKCRKLDKEIWKIMTNNNNITGRTTTRSVVYMLVFATSFRKLFSIRYCLLRHFLVLVGINFLLFCHFV